MTVYPFQSSISGPQKVYYIFILDWFGSWLSGVHRFWTFKEAQPLKVRTELNVNMIAGLITKKKTYLSLFSLRNYIFLHLRKLKENDDTCMYILSVAEASRSDSSTSRKRAIACVIDSLALFLGNGKEEL